MDAAQLYPFLVASLVFVAVPGANTVYIVTCAADRGRRAGILSALGVETGTLVHVGVAAAGLAALVAAFPVALAVIRLAGGAYLLYLGFRALLGPPGASEGAAAEPSLWRSYRDGLVVNVLNPKVALFFLAFLPQFVADGAPVRPQMLLLGVVFLGLALLVDLGYAVAAGALGDRLAGRRRTRAVRRYLVAAVYLGLGAWAGVSGVV
ncbi:MAG: LysE family translocator [Stackebrandtia sp.]